MGTRSGNYSSSGAVLMARQVLMVLVAVLAGTSSCGALPPLSVTVVNVTFANTLKVDILKVTFGQSVIGTSPTVDIPPGEGRDLPVEVQAPLLLDAIYFQVGSQVYSTPGSSLQSRILGESGANTFYITGNCPYKKPGLQFVVTTALDMCTFLGCAAPVTT